MASGRVTLTLPKSNSMYIKWETVGQTGMVSHIYWECWYGNWNTTNGVFCNIEGSISTPIETQSCVYTDYVGGGAAPSNKRYSFGYIDVIRDRSTNQGTLTIEMSYSSGYTSKDEAFSGGSASNTFIINTSTTYGVPAQITDVSDFTDETSPMVTYTYDKGTQVTSVNLYAGISFTGSQIDIPYRLISATGTSYVFNFTAQEKETLYSLLATGPTASVRFMIKTEETVSGEILTQEKSFTKTFSFINYWPLLRPEVWDINPATIAVTNDSSVIVKYMSTVNYKMNATPRKGAKDIIGSYVVNTGGSMQEGFLEGTYGTPTSNTFYFSATDDRGYTGTYTLGLSSFDGEFIEYIKLTNSVKCTPISTDGIFTATITGKYFNYKFGPNGRSNTLTFKYRVYERGRESTATWSDPIVIQPTMVDSSTYTYSFQHGNLDYTKQYIVEASVSDLLNTEVSKISIVAKPVFYWNNDEFFFTVPITVPEITMPGSSLDSVVEEKTATGYYMDTAGAYKVGGYTWYYRKWTSGLLECWCTLPFTTTVTTTWGNLYIASISNSAKTDLSYPVQPIDTPLVVTSLGGGATRGMLVIDSSYAADNVSTGRYNIASPVSITSNATFRINYYVRGKWK